MKMNNKNMFTVSIDKEFDVLKKEYSNSIYLRLYTSLFESGIVKDLKPTNFTVLLVITSFMDDEGNCYPTQRQISELSGISLPTVNKAVNSLLKFEINGTPILRREMVKTGRYKNSYYTVNPITPITISGNSEKYDKDLLKELSHNVISNKDRDIDKDLKCKNLKQDTKKVNKETETSTNTDIKITDSKEVIDYFYQKYKEVYDETFTSNFGRDAGQINNKLIGKFTSEQLKLMIDTTIEEYESRWKNDRFKRPTIVAMCTWLGSEALAVANDKREQDNEIMEAVEKFNNANKSALSKFGVDSID